MKKLLKISLAVAAVAALCNATEYKLSDLLNDDLTIQVGDKQFSDWDFGVINGNINAASIFVEAGGPGGIAGAPWNDLWVLKISGLTLSSLDRLWLSYTVNTVSGEPLITDIHQALRDASGSFMVTEFGEVGSLTVAQSRVSYGVNGAPDVDDPPAERGLPDILYFSPVSSLSISNYIEVPSRTTGGGAVLWQGFSQVPDGGWTLVLLGSGFTGLAALRRKVG
jgi:hypothetical protein